MAKRFWVQQYGTPYEEPFAPAFHPDRLSEPAKAKKSSKIFVCSMSDLLGDWVPWEWICEAGATAMSCPQHIFQFLTKNPKRLKDFNPWPKNCWVGTTVTNQGDADERVSELFKADAPVRFVSCEPLLSKIDLRRWLYASEEQRGNGLSSCINGHFGDRQPRSDMASSSKNGEPLAGGNKSISVPEEKGREDGWSLSKDFDTISRGKTGCFSPPSCLETFQRPNSQGDDNQSQKRENPGEFYGKPGTGDLSAATATRRECPGMETQTGQQGALSWIICGAMTGPGSQKHQPKREWVQSLIDQARAAGVPVFLKDNLHWPEQVQQWPTP
jgi:protein gp37